MAECMSNVLLYVARVLRDQLKDLLLGIPGLRATLNFAAQRILVSQGALQTLDCRESNALMLPPGRHSRNENVMTANVWSALPPELLDLVFAHLPVPDIQRLRVLSKDWKQNLETPDSEFRRMCAAEECSSRFAVICPKYLDGKFSVNTFDSRTSQWQAFEYRAPPGRRKVTICACDGGLVCFLYESTEVPSAEQGGHPPELCMSVWNPVTGGEVRLSPFPALSDFSQCAARLYVNRQTKSFRVLFVRSLGVKNISAHVFDSVAWEWKTVEKSSTPIFWSCAGPVPGTGSSSPWLPPHGLLTGYCDYDSAGETFKSRASGFGILHRDRLKVVAITEDKCFLLLEKKVRASVSYVIFEYDHGESKFHKAYRCSPLANSPRGICSGICKVELQACKNHLILDARSLLQRRRWLLDLTTGKWRDLPALPEDNLTSCHVELQCYVLCELQWKVCPQSSNRK